MKKTHTYLKVLVLAIVANFIINASAGASDQKHYAGALCQPNNGLDQDRVRHWHNGLRNHSPQFLWVTCPVVKDDIAAKTTGIDFWQVAIEQFDLQTTDCWLRSADFNGSSVSQQMRSRTGSGTIFGGSLPTFFGGYISLQCRLPPWARLIQYLVDEEGPTDSD